jgi:hypothetical protein
MRGGVIVNQCFVDQGPVTIGREPPSDMTIDDPIVGKEHARIIAVGNDHIIEDLHTPHGTFVNGRPVERHILQHNDVIEFGEYLLQYLNRRAAEDDSDRTMLIPSLKGKANAAASDPNAPGNVGRVPTARAAKVAFPKGRAKMTGGRRAGRVIELNRVVATFGRPGVELAVLARRPAGYFLTYVEGKRYPRVNRQTIGREPHMLRSGDIVEVGDEKMEFVLD